MANLKWGSKGSGVKALQDKLNKAGAKPKLTADGVFGKKTFEAVKAFQKAHGKLKVDGVAGPKTLAEVAKGKPGGAKDDKAKDAKGKDAKGKDAKGGGKKEAMPKWPYPDLQKDLRSMEKNLRENKKASLSLMKDLAKKDTPACDLFRKKIVELDEHIGDHLQRVRKRASTVNLHKSSHTTAVKKGDAAAAKKAIEEAKYEVHNFKVEAEEYDDWIKRAIELETQAKAALEGRSDGDGEVDWPYRNFIEVDKDRKKRQPKTLKLLEALATDAMKLRGSKEGDALIKEITSLISDYDDAVKKSDKTYIEASKIQRDFNKVKKSDHKKAWDLVSKAKPYEDSIEDNGVTFRRFTDRYRSVKAEIEKALAIAARAGASA